MYEKRSSSDRYFLASGRRSSVLGVSLAIFGACTVNLGLLLMANLHLLQAYGWLSATDGAIAQALGARGEWLCWSGFLCDLQRVASTG